MNLERIDQLLGDWSKKIELVSQNLIDLHGLATYQRLTGASGFPKAQLTGITQARVTPALEAMTELFGHFDLLVTTIDKAFQLRKQISSLWVSESKINEIKQILTGNSIQLAVIQIPLAQQQLQQLKEIRAKAEAALAESQEKVVDRSTLKTPLTNEQIDAIAQWLTRLENKPTCRVGFDK